MNQSNKTVLVTGADGFIGSHLVEALVRAGYRVRALVLYNSFGHWGWLEQVPPEIIKNVEIRPGDIRDQYLVRKALEGVPYLFHLASLISIPYSYLAVESFVDTNIKGTLNLLLAAREAGIEKFFHISTSEIYGTAQKIPIDEKHSVTAQSPYAASKIAADALAESFRRSYELPLTILRPFNTYGPRQSARAVIPAIITQIASGQEEVKLGALTPRRDFTFVDDMVEAFLLAAQKEKLAGENINIGTGQDITIGELAQKIAALMGRKVRFVEDRARLRPENSEVKRLVCDASRAQQLLGWKPRRSLAEGLERTIAWFLQAENLVRYKHDRYNI